MNATTPAQTSTPARQAKLAEIVKAACAITAAASDAAAKAPAGSVPVAQTPAGGKKPFHWLSGSFARTGAFMARAIGCETPEPPAVPVTPHGHLHGRERVAAALNAQMGAAPPPLVQSKAPDAPLFGKSRAAAAFNKQQRLSMTS